MTYIEDLAKKYGMEPQCQDVPSDDSETVSDRFDERVLDHHIRVMLKEDDATQLKIMQLSAVGHFHKWSPAKKCCYWCGMEEIAYICTKPKDRKICPTQTGVPE